MSLTAEERGMAAHAYTTEEMSYKYDENAAWPMLVVGIQALESILLPVLIQHGQVGDFVQISLGRWAIVDLNVAFEVGGRVFDSHLLVERGSRVFSYGVNPKD